MSSTAPTLTLQDVADLARVRRPVVSMWRKRSTVRGRSVPFPEPVESDGVERFSRDDVVEWLERTGRGNNGETRLDAPALSVPSETSMEDLAALLCLRACTGEELSETTAGRREALATGADPRDEFMRREVEAAAAREDVLRFVDDLAEASYGFGDALTRLESGRIGRATGVRDLTSEAVELVRTVATSCELCLDPEGASLVHAGDGPASATLTLALAGDFAHLIVPGDSAQSRALRRRATIHELDVSTDDGNGPRVRVLSVVGCEPDTALQAIDDVVLELEASDVAVILGPAGVMCDELRGEREKNRAGTLRPGNLALALRLPRGMWREAHRQALGLWVCSGRTENPRPLVADLAAFTQDELEATDLAADVAGALGQGAQRSFRYARPHDLSRIVSSHAVVPRGVRAQRMGTSDVAPHVERIQAATLATAEPIDGFDIPVAAAPGAVLLRTRSISELKELGHASVKRGSRIDTKHTDPAGSVAVLSANGATDGVTLDPFDARELYPRAARTEPGDVVFAERPRPMALIDAYGGSLVASPSRILRLSPTAGIGPRATAAIINRLPREAGECLAWNVPILDPAAVERLEETLAAAAVHEASVRRHLDAVEDLVGSLIDGVAAGAVTLDPRTDR